MQKETPEPKPKAEAFDSYTFKPEWTLTGINISISYLTTEVKKLASNLRNNETTELRDDAIDELDQLTEIMARLTDVKGAL